MQADLFSRQLALWQNLAEYRYTGISMKFCPECAGELQQKTIDGIARLVCMQTDCQFVYWNNPVPVVAALVRLEGNYILARNAQWPSQQFSLISGYLECGETPEQAAIREVREELGLDGHSVAAIGNYAFYEKNQLILAYAVDTTGSVQINHELADTISLSREALLAYDFGPFMLTRRIILDWQRANPV